MKPALECVDIRKQYGQGGSYALGRATAGIDCRVSQGELFAIIGPSGCGKSTLLRIIGGFIEPTAGRVMIAGQEMTNRPPHSRPTNMVFQNYALFPHLTIGENVSFGLEMENVPSQERKVRVNAALDLVGLVHLQARYVNELSGGQMQRAALARALVKRPAVVLLDEPLGALDLKLRRQMQDEIVRLKNEIGMTVIHVTHDQEEACAMADKIAVLNAGELLQVDTPLNLYGRPKTAFVADFINAGTVLRGNIEHSGRQLRLTNSATTVVAADGEFVSDGRLAVLLPRHGMEIRRGGEEDGTVPNEIRGQIIRLAFSGVDYTAQVRARDATIVTAQLSIEQVAAHQLDLGASVVLSCKAEQVRVLVDDEPANTRTRAAAE